MRTIYAKDHGILPGGDVAKKLNVLLAELKGDKEEKILVLEEGEYFLDSDNVPEPFLYITNTIGDNEWKDGETPHKNRVGLFFDGIENLTLEGNKAVFIAKGQMTNLAARDCRGLTVKNIVFRAENPDMHALKVVKKAWDMWISDRTTKAFIQKKTENIISKAKASERLLRTAGCPRTG